MEVLVENLELTSIQKFYSDSHVLITGATGFMGKILLEKLLRSCPSVSKIYLLIRSKKGKDPYTRLDEIFEDAPFQVLKRTFPSYRKKVIGVAGDCVLPDLGLSEEDKKILIDKVNIIFHVAATVRFDENLKTAAASNVRATVDLLNIAHQIENLKAFVYVSTVYSNCNNKVIEEKVYPPAVEYKQFLSLADYFSTTFLEKITPSLLEDYPNTYTLTKQIAESVLKECGKGLPVAIVRPSIVVSTYKEPIKAWIGNLYGVTGAAAAAGVGLMRTMRCDLSLNSNLVPVDMCINATIAAAWDINGIFRKAREAGDEPDIRVYNYESSNDQPITWGRVMADSQRYGTRKPTIKAIWYYNMYISKDHWKVAILTFLLHMVPAYIVDAVLFCRGEKQRMVNVYRKLHKFSELISYFCTQEWTFMSHNVRNLLDKMSDRDREIFFCDIKNLDWTEFFHNYLLGVRVYLVKDPIDTLDAAQIKWRRFYWADRILKAVLAFIALGLLWSLFSCLCNLVF